MYIILKRVPNIPNTISNICRNFLELCFNSKLTADQLQKHEYLKEQEEVFNLEISDKIEVIEDNYNLGFQSEHCSVNLDQDESNVDKTIDNNIPQNKYTNLYYESIN